MANRYDAADLATDAQRLEALATSARSTMLNHTTEKATRLGADGERLGRQARAADSQRVEADQMAATLSTEAAGYDAKAAGLDQRAAAAAARGDYAGTQEATELREEAAKAREGGTVARNKSDIASADAKRLAAEAAELRAQEQAIDAELADLGGRMPATEIAVDHLEWHAEKARAMADAVKQADDLSAQAVSATGRGDHAAATELSRRAASLRDDADVLAFVRERPPFPDDYAALQVIGVTVTAADLSVPLPELIDPNSPMNPLADASGASGDDVSVAAAAEMSNDTPSADSPFGDSAVAASADESSVASASVDDADAQAVTSVAESSFDTSSFETSSFETPSFEMPTFEDPVVADAFSDGFDSPSLGTPDDAFDAASFETDTAFGGSDALG